MEQMRRFRRQHEQLRAVIMRVLGPNLQALSAAGGVQGDGDRAEVSELVRHSNNRLKGGLVVAWVLTICVVHPDFHWRNILATVFRKFHRQFFSRWLHLNNLCRESIAQDDIFATMNSRVESRPTVDDDFCQWKSGDMICVDEIIRIRSLWIKYNRYGFNQPLGLHTSFPADLL